MPTAHRQPEFAKPAPGKPPTAVRLTGWLMTALLISIAWGWSGMRPSWLRVGAWMALGLAVLAVIGGGRPLLRAWLRDPVFWCGLLFLAYLSVAWLNAGRSLYLDVGHGVWRYTPVRWPGWPGAFTRIEAAQMLHWFFPAGVLVMILRARLLQRGQVRRLLLALIASAALLALIGLVQLAAGSRAIYGMGEVESDRFFASFPYVNHAAAYFVMLAALAAGRLLHRLFRGERPLPRFNLVALSVAALLCLIGANLTASRAGVMHAWALALLVAVYGMARGWRRLRPAGKINTVLATLAAGFVFFFAVSGFGGDTIRTRFVQATAPAGPAGLPVPDIETVLGGDRPVLRAAAWNIFREHRWFGAGGWGYRYLLAFHLPADKMGYLNAPGKANVHNDPMQFLAEFGVVGVGLMALILIGLLAALLRRGHRYGACFTITFAGLLLTVIHSLVDLTFRCPAILWTWCTILAALPIVCANPPTPATSGNKDLRP